MQNIEVSAGSPASESADSAAISAVSQLRGDSEGDRELVMRVQGGDLAAFGDLIDRHQRSVYGIVSRMVSNREDVDDLVQEIFVAAYGAIGKFRGDARFSTWFHSIAVNMTLKRLKQMKRKNAISIDDPETGLAATLRADDGSSPGNAALAGERSEAVRKAIDSLPEKQRVVVIMHYFEQHTCDEIAAVLKCSVGTVWSRLHYACKKLKGELRWLEQGF